MISLKDLLIRFWEESETGVQQEYPNKVLAHFNLVDMENDTSTLTKKEFDVFVFNNLKELINYKSDPKIESLASDFASEPDGVFEKILVITTDKSATAFYIEYQTLFVEGDEWLEIYSDLGSCLSDHNAFVNKIFIFEELREGY